MMWCSAPDSCPSRVASARDTSDQTSFPPAASVEPESADLGSLSAKCLLTFQVLKVYVLSARGSKCSGLAIFITREQGVDDTKRHFFRWWNWVLYYEPSILSFQEAKGTFVLIEFAELLLGHGLQQKITPPPRWRDAKFRMAFGHSDRTSEKLVEWMWANHDDSSTHQLNFFG